MIALFLSWMDADEWTGGHRLERWCEQVSTHDVSLCHELSQLLGLVT